MSLRVLHVTPTLDPLSGGTTAAVDGLARAQAAAGLAVTVVATHGGASQDSFAGKLRDAGVDVVEVGPAAGALLRAPGLTDALQSHIDASDVTHVHGIWEEPQYAAIDHAARRGVPCMLSPHGMLDRWSLRQKWLKKKLYRLWRLDRVLKRLDAFHLTTEEESRSVARLGFPARRVVMPLGLDLSEFDPPPAPGRFRDRCPELGDAPFILFLSRLHVKKGIEILIPAAARLMAQRPELHLVVAGPPDSEAYLATLTEQADATGHGSRMHFVGNQAGRERIEAMVDAKVFALISYQENFGIVVAEAAAAGLPVVISEAVNLADLVDREGLGTVVPLDSEHAATALARYLDQATDEESRTRQHCRERAFAAFDWREIGPRWEGVYRDLMSHPTPPRTPAAG